jgi:hypothetical protein
MGLSWKSVGGFFTSPLGSIAGADPALKVKAPPPRDFAGEMRNMLAASEDLYKNQQEYSPRYTQLGLQNQNLSLYGNSQTPGVLDQYMRALPMLSGAQAGAGYSNVNQYGGPLAASMRASNPQQQALMDELNRQAMMGLQAENQLAPQDIYNTVQPVRQDWSNRGLGRTQPGMLEEALQLSRFGDGRQQQRQQFAQGVAGMENQFYTAPANSYALGAADSSNLNGLMGMADKVGDSPTNWEQLSPYASDVNNTNYNAEAAARIATGNNKTAMMSSAMSY